MATGPRVPGKGLPGTWFGAETSRPVPAVPGPPRRGAQQPGPRPGLTARHPPAHRLTARIPRGTRWRARSPRPRLLRRLVSGWRGADGWDPSLSSLSPPLSGLLHPAPSGTTPVTQTRASRSHCPQTSGGGGTGLGSTGGGSSPPSVPAAGTEAQCLQEAQGPLRAGAAGLRAVCEPPRPPRRSAPDTPLAAPHCPPTLTLSQAPRGLTQDVRFQPPARALAS